MKKKLILFLIVIIIMGLILLLTSNHKGKCQNGIDTIKIFGETCRYEIFSGETAGYKRHSFDDEEKFKNVDKYIIDYIEKNNNVYVIGSKGYTKINYKTNNLVQTYDINMFNNNDKIIFDELKEQIIKKYKINIYLVSNISNTFNIEITDKEYDYTYNVPLYLDYINLTNEYIKYNDNNLLFIEGYSIKIVGQKNYKYISNKEYMNNAQ